MRPLKHGYPGALAVILCVVFGSSVAAQTMEPPIYDIHFHAMPFVTPGELLAHMQRFAIPRQGGAGASGTPDSPPPPGERAFEEALKDSYISAVGMAPMLVAQREAGAAAFEDATHPAAVKAQRQVEAFARDRGARVIGEMHVNSANFAPQPSRRKVAGDGPFARAVGHRRQIRRAADDSL